jgi:hypothetical protein
MVSGTGLLEDSADHGPILNEAAEALSDKILSRAV